MQSCALVPIPNPTIISNAPESVRNSIKIDHTRSPPLIDVSYTVHLSPDSGQWIKLPVLMDGNQLFVSGYFAPNDDDGFVSLSRILIDTGYNGVLSFPSANSEITRAWVSEEIGKQSHTNLGGLSWHWTGAGSALALGGVEISPIPFKVGSGAQALRVDWPLLGQLWFDLMDASWVDPESGTVAVSFDSRAIRDAITVNPNDWIELPWQKALPDSHRFIPIRLDHERYEAIIDTGSDAYLILLTHETPPLVNRPWGQGTFGGTQHTKYYRAKSAAPMYLGDIEINDIELGWLKYPGNLTNEITTEHPVAVLGVPFLRKFPALLDHKQNKAWFYVGDRDNLESYKMPIHDPFTSGG